MHRFSLSHQQRHRRDAMKGHIEEDTRGPSTAQKHLRDLAHSQPARMLRKDEDQPRSVAGEEEGGLLEFQDITDYGNG